MPVLSDGTTLNSTIWDRLIGAIPSKYTVYVASGNYYAEANFSGGTDYGPDTDASTVIQQALDAMTSGDRIVFKQATYDIQTQLDVDQSHNVEIVFENGADFQSDQNITFFDVNGKDYIIFVNPTLTKSGSPAGSQDGIRLDNADHCRIIYPKISNLARYGVYFVNGATYNSIQGGVIDGCQYNIITDVNNNTEHIDIYGLESKNATYDGVYSKASYTIVGWCRVHDNGRQGIALEGHASYNHVNSKLLHNWSYGNSNNNGISIEEDVDNTIAIGNHLLTNAYGLMIVDSNCDDTIVTNNFFSGNTTAPVDDSGTGTIFKNNKGYVTENTGNSTGTGSEQTIAHGLDDTPNSVIITPTASGATISGLYVDATNFYVTVTSAKTYNWYAEV